MCDRSIGQQFEVVTCRKHSGQNVDVLGQVTGQQVNILRQWCAGNILVKVSTFWDVWQVNGSTFWSSEVQKIFWSKCRPSEMWPSPGQTFEADKCREYSGQRVDPVECVTGQHFEADKCREYSGQSVDLLGCVPGWQVNQHFEYVKCRKFSGQSVDQLRCVTGQEVNILKQINVNLLGCVTGQHVACWGDDMPETFWSKCQPSGMCNGSTGQHFEADEYRKHSGQSVDLLGCVTYWQVNILRQGHAGNILVKVSMFWDAWQVDRSTSSSSKVPETFWSKCHLSGMWDRSTGQYFEADKWRKRFSQSVDLLGCDRLTGQHF